jgi:L-alanine-DL-glutamate epimerase-like enolase superfamily enzyme
VNDPKITLIEWARLSGRRPRKAGCNARLGEHGQRVALPIARITTNDGTKGFGLSKITRDQAAKLVGFRPNEAFELQNGVHERFRVLEYPIWDLVGKLAQKPVYALIGRQPDDGKAYRVPCYDTSLYMDDLYLEDDDKAAALMASEALDGIASGHRAFKIKVGRGAMHMPLEKGTRRDVRVIRAVREAVGSESKILIDVNNGYNLNLTKRVLADTADATLYWVEEPFHEDPVLYDNLKGWLNSEGLAVLIADGEGDSARHLLDWARKGLIDVVQVDAGFTRWLEVGSRLDRWNVRSAPHHYGEPFGNYSSCHLAAGIQRFEFVEWDEASILGLDASTYSISEGYVNVPNLPGFGLRLDEGIYAQAVRENGYALGEA